MRTFKKPIILVAILATVLTSSSLTSLAAQKNTNRNTASPAVVSEACLGNNSECSNPDGVCTQDGVRAQDGTGIGNGGECSNPDGVCTQDGVRAQDGTGNGGVRKGNGKGCTL